MNVKIQIGEMAKYHNISAQTLRYYDSIDLFKPLYTDENTGYRYYGIEQFAHLESILFLKGMGMSLKKIKDYFKNRDIHTMASLLKQRSLSIEDELIKLKSKQQKIISLMEMMDNYLKEDLLDTFRIQTFPERYMIFFHFGNGEVVYEHEYGIKKLGMALKDNDDHFLNPFSTVIDRKDIQDKNYTKFKGISIIFERKTIDSDAAITLPQGEYATVAFVGSYKDVSGYFEKLCQWIENKGYKAAGDGLILILIDKAFSDYEYEYISEIQIPINK